MPGPAFTEFAGGQESIDDVFTYTVTDANGNTATATDTRTYTVDTTAAASVTAHSESFFQRGKSSIASGSHAQKVR